MLRVALVIDDYNELIYLQTILRKIGIDVEGLQNVKKYSELSLGFNPQVLIASAFGKKVNGLEFTRTLHRVRGLPKIILLRNVDQVITPDEIKDLNIDMVLESPVNPNNLIHGLSAVANVDETSLVDKFRRLQASGSLAVPEEFQINGEEEAVVRETPQFAFRDRGQSHQGSNLKIKVEEDPNIYVGGSRADGTPNIAVSELRSQSLSGAQSGTSEAAGSTAAIREGLAPQRSEFVGKAGIPRAVIEQTPEDIEKRRQRFSRYVGQTEPLQNKEAHFERDRIFQFNKKMRSVPLSPDVNEIEGDRKLFVKNLFTKDRK